MRILILSCALAFLSNFSYAAAAPKKSWRKTPQLSLKDNISKHLDGNHREYFKSVIDAGYSSLDLEVIDAEGNFYFESKPLSDNAWRSKTDALSSFCSEWSRVSKSTGASKVGLSLNVAYLARLTGARDLPGRLHRPNVNQVDDVLSNLIENYRSSELSSVCFPPEYMPVALGSFRNARRKFNLIVSPPLVDAFTQSGEFDYATFNEFVQRFTVEEADLSDPKKLGRDSHSIGYVNLMFAWANTLKKEAWLDLGSGHPAWHNLVLFRIAQYAPRGLTGTEEDFTHLKFSGLNADIDQFYTLPQNVPPAGRRVANLILGSKKERKSEPLISEYIDPIMNALEANGYEVHVTFGKIEEKADLYYVVNGNDWLADVPFMDAVVDLMDYRKSHFYGTVILHPMGEILNDGPWARVREMFHIPNGEGGWIHDLPESIVIKMKPLPWSVGQNFKDRGMTRLREIQARQFGAEILMSHVFEGDTLGFIFKAGPHYLINGNFLHLGASYFLSKLIGGAIQSSSSVYVTANRKRTCAFAVEPSRLKLKLPVPDAKSDWTLTYFDAEGLRVRDETIRPIDVLELDMQPFELLIVQTEP